MKRKDDTIMIHLGPRLGKSFCGKSGSYSGILSPETPREMEANLPANFKLCKTCLQMWDRYLGDKWHTTWMLNRYPAWLQEHTKAELQELKQDLINKLADLDPEKMEDLAAWTIYRELETAIDYNIACGKYKGYVEDFGHNIRI